MPARLAAAANGSVGPGRVPRFPTMVSDPTRLGELSWGPPPPLVTVVVESQLAIHADVAEWVAVIRYDVLGGGLDRINLKIPAAWAARATLHHSGEDRRTSAQVIGPSAFWTIAPERPLWGSHRFVLRAESPVTSATEISFPELRTWASRGPSTPTCAS